MKHTVARRALPLGALVLLGCSKLSSASAAQQTSQISASAQTTVSQRRQTAITAAVSRVAPSVVTVQTVSLEQIPPNPFEFMFGGGGGGGGTRATPGLGSGFVIQPDGVIVTNAHVVAGADTLSVMMRDGTVYPAKVVGKDEANDIAVIKIDAKNLPVVKLGNSSNLLIGEWAIAIGNPYGFLLGNSEPSVTAGVISGVGRNLVGEGEGPALYFDMIQTDASINPGNSGGPLVNADGEVIGVNSSIYSPSGGSIGLGFAIPINRVVHVVDDLLTTGTVRRPWIGVSMQATSANPRDMIAKGAAVQSVAPQSPAASAGLQAGDVIVKVGARTVRNPFDWEAALLDLRVGESADLTVKRGDRIMDEHVTVGDTPETTAPKVQVLKELELVTLTAAIRAERSIKSQSGALVYTASDAISNEIGIKAGDVITQINTQASRTRITSADDVKKVLDALPSRGYAQLVIERNGQAFLSPAFSIPR